MTYDKPSGDNLPYPYTTPPLKIGTSGYKLNPTKLKDAPRQILPYLFTSFYFTEEFEYFDVIKPYLDIPEEPKTIQRKFVTSEIIMKNDPKRATGRTTGLMLQTIGRAVENPGTEVEFIDHHEQNHAQLLCKERIESIAKQLNLDVSVEIRSNKLDDRFRPEPFSLYVKSNWVSPYAQRTSMEEE